MLSFFKVCLGVIFLGVSYSSIASGVPGNSGLIFVGDYSRNQIVVCDPSQASCKPLAKTFESPLAIVTGKDNRPYLIEGASPKIPESLSTLHRLNIDGSIDASWTIKLPQPEPTYNISPIGFAFTTDKDGNKVVFIAMYLWHEEGGDRHEKTKLAAYRLIEGQKEAISIKDFDLSVFDVDGYAPCGMAIDDQGNLYVAEHNGSGSHNTGYIHFIRKSDKAQFDWVKNDPAHPVEFPCTIVVRDGRTFVADAANQILVLNSGGAVVDTIKDANIGVPSGLAIVGNIAYVLNHHQDIDPDHYIANINAYDISSNVWKYLKSVGIVGTYETNKEDSPYFIAATN